LAGYSIGHDKMRAKQTTVADLEPSRVAVVLIDFQNTFCHPDSSIREGVVSNRETALRANDFAAAAAHLGASVVYTQQILDVATLAPRQRQWARTEDLCRKGTWGAELFLPPIPDATVVTKHRYDIWQSAEFLRFVEATNPDGFVFAGVELCCCVLYGVLGADERGFQYSVPMSLVSGIDPGAKTYNRAVREFLTLIHEAPEEADGILEAWRDSQPSAG